MKHYFFKAVKEYKKIKLKIVPNQTFHGDILPISEDIIFVFKIDYSRLEEGKIYFTDQIKNYGRLGKKLVDSILELDKTTNEIIAQEYINITNSPVLTLKKEIEDSLKINYPTISTDGFYVEQETWILLLRNIKRKINTIISGPTGAGKTSLVSLACKKLGLPLNIYDMGAMFDPISGLLGVHRLQEGGVSIFDYAKFTQDIQKPGVILLDELPRAAMMSNNVLFPCLDDRRTLPVEIAGGKDLRSIPIHPEVCFIATANIGVEYTGSLTLDRALKDRFFHLDLTYLSEKDETSLLIKRSGILPTHAASITKVATELRQIYEKEQISNSISTRETLMIAELVRDGWSLPLSLSKIILPMYEGTSTSGERSIVNKVLMSL